MNDLGKQIYHQVRPQVFAQIRGVAEVQIACQVLERVRVKVGAQVVNKGWEHINDQVYAQVMSQIRANLKANHE